MTGERWWQVWQLCEGARQIPREERTEYVRANAADPDAAREALSLLAEPDESVFASWSPGSTSGGMGGGIAVRPARNLAGLRIGRYEVGDIVGSGASGDVYFARDTELERPVAMKFLRCDSSESRWKVEWFLREAKAASALNHPGIITVHEMIQSESGLAIVMELVDGTALRKLCGSPMAVDRVIRCGSQVAHALAAAHSRNIIHRDIKPENIMLRADGLTKLLDFGLAQSLGGPDHGLMSQLRGGTLRYMSPEQATGETLTPATDIFSFGLVLYELLAGRHPFPASSVEATLQSICFDQPGPPSRWQRDIPRPLDTLILDMLAKAPDARPAAADVAGRLDKLVPSAEKSRGRLWLFGALAVLAVAILGIAWFNWRGNQESPRVGLTAIPLTATAGFDSWPDISPDGDDVVYGWGKSPDAYTHIYLRRLDQDTPVKLLEAEPGTRIGHPKWSSDGRRIYYKRTSPRLGFESIWSIARDGTDPRLTVSLTGAELSSGIDCSPDGKRIIYADRIGNVWRFGIQSLDLASGQKTVLTAPSEGWGDWDPHYSPDGEKIAFKRVKTPGDDQLYVMPASGGSARQLTSRRQSIFGHTWLPQGKLLVSAQLGSVIHGLWRISAEGAGEQTAVFESGLDATMPAVSRNRIVWVNRANDYNIYSVPVAGGKPVKRIASAMLDSKPAFAPDGRLAYVSRRSGSPEVWITGAEGANAVRITNLRGDVGRPVWSPNGTRIAFSMQRFGATKVFTMRCTPAALQCESLSPLVDGESPTWSHDGKSLYFRSTEDQQIRKLPLSGGQAARIASGQEALTSDDGKWLYLTRLDPDGRYFRVRLDNDGNRTGAEERVLGRGSNSAGLQHWALAGDEILFWESNINSKFSGLRAYHTVTKRLRTVVETPAAEYPAVSPDGKTVWYAQPDAAGGTLMAAEWAAE